MSKRGSLVQQALTLRANELGSRVIHGASYTFLGIFLRTAITLGSVAILARLLTPADFGYVAMATIVTELAALLGNFGLTNLLVQRKTVARIQIDTVFWTSVAIGTTLTLGVFSVSFFADILFNDTTSGELLRVLCLTFLISSLTIPHEAVLARLMRFDLDFMVQITGVAVRAGSAILFALAGYGVWSLVFGPIVGALTMLIFWNVIVPYRPRLRFHKAYVRQSWKTGGSYFGSGLLYYINMNLDLMLVGRQLGASALGFYSNARTLTDDVRARIAVPLQRVLFPAFSSIQNDLPRLQHSVVRSARMLTAIITPIGVGLAAVSQDLVPLLYGDQWLAMIPVVSYLGIGAAIRGTSAMANPLFYSLNKVGLLFRVQLVGTVLFGIAIVFALPYGLEATALAVMLQSLYYFVGLRIGLGLISLNTKHIVSIVFAPSLASGIMWLALYKLGAGDVMAGLSPAITLFAKIALGAVVYALAMFIVSRKHVADFVDILKRFRKA